MREKIKNSFQEGLIMDFSPEHTLATYLTNALNATFITNNGNEMALQNDMGNGRVETAFLPEGYIPVGTCEYGDIIYIVSYNPLENKSQIGCFPSPERNIASDELGDLNQTLKYTDFLETDVLTGTLKASSVKKILMGEKYLHPGDKFIIAAKNLDANGSCLSDYAGNKTHNYLPKYLKIHVVSIEDSGKIVYLDSDIKWNLQFYINNYNIDETKEDIDDYRKQVTSNYSVFTSKVSGKLALLIELEKITAFDCSWFAIPVSETETNTNTDLENENYDIYLEFNWDADNYNISPKKYIKSDPKSKLNYENGILGIDENESLITFTNHYEYTLGTLYKEDDYINDIKLNDDYSWSNSTPDSIVNYHYKKPVYKKLFTVTGIPLKKEYYTDDSTTLVINNLSNTYYECDIVPCMPYGKLDELKLHIRIDFDKIGTKNINLHTWKYYNYDNITTLTWGLDAYTQPNYTIKEVTFEFYDDKGFVCAYHNVGKKSYNGVFTENIILDLLNSNYKINNIQYSKPDSSSTEEIEEIEETKEIDSRTIIQSNFLYLVKIIVLYRKLNLDGTIPDSESDSESASESASENDEVFYRWIWTNGMWNEFYYQCLDFNDLKFNLELDLGVHYSQIDPSKPLAQTVLYEGTNTLEENTANDEYKNLKANVTYNLDESSNIQAKINPGLINTYNTFSLHSHILEEGVNVGIQVINDNHIDTNQSEVEYIDELNNINLEILKPNIGTYKDNNYSKEYGLNLIDLLNLKLKTSEKHEINSEDYCNYKDWFTFILNTTNTSTISTEKSNKKYISYNGNEEEYTPDFKTQDLNGVYLYNNDSSKPFEFTFNTILFNKYYELRKTKEIECFIIKPVIYSPTDLEKYNFKYIKLTGKYDFNSYCSMAMWWDDAHKIRYFYYDSKGNPLAFLEGEADDYQLNSKNPLKIHEVLQVTGGSLYDFCKGFTPFILVKEDGKTNLYQIGIRNYLNPLDKKTKFENLKKSTGILTLPNVSNQLNILNFYYNPGNEYYHSNNNNIAKMLISLLSQLYYCNGEIGKYLYKSLQNVVYYKPFEYTLTKDILYHIDNIDLASDLICIKDELYSTYVTNVINLVKIFDSNCKEYITDTTLKLHEVTKNYPIQFKFKYVQPSYYDEGTPKYLVKCSDGNDFTYNSGVINNKLYCIKDGELKTPTSKDTYYMCNKITEDQNAERLTFEYDETSANNFGNIYPNFTMYNDEFRCTATTINSGIEIVEIDNANSNKVRGKLQYIKTDEILDHDLKFNK